MANSQSSDIDSLKQRIVELTQKSWSEHNKALFLARLGKVLVQEGLDLRTLLRGEKLSPFIQRELKNEVRIVQSPKDPLIFAVVPQAASLTGDLLEYFAPPPTHDKSMLFDARLWAAFSKPLPPGKTRRITLAPSIHFSDVEPTSKMEEGEIEIPADAIVPIGSKPQHERNTILQKGIHDWLKSKGINREAVRATDTSTLAWRHDNSILSLLIASLDHRELQRITIPLDVVAKLLKQKIDSKS